MKCRLSIFFLSICLNAFPQAQTCPVNINFGTGDLTHWYAYTGNNMQGSGPNALRNNYDSIYNAPGGTIGARAINEYSLGNVRGIQVITTSYQDIFGGFPTIPTINGYSYKYTILLGSTAITRGTSSAGGGGYVRGVSYSILVPPGPATEPYTMTYAYAMVLENGTHVSNEQPVITATLKTPAGIIDCASPSYLLPTFNNVVEGGRGATLDSATAKKNGFKVSSTPTPNESFGFAGQPQGNLLDVWTKGWTEVTFDLSAYRGQKVSLTFEADNCVPGGHFAYAYIAIRNSCAGLQISGDSLACYNTGLIYSVPALAGATYSWNIPDSWKLLSTDTGNIIHVKSATNGGFITVREKNGCADLTDTIQIKTQPSPVGGDLEGSTAVCTGINNSHLILFNYSGLIQNWISSTDSINWTIIPNLTETYLAENLTATTYYKAVVGKGSVCPPDSSSPAIIRVDQKSIGGEIDPPLSTLCAGQIAGETLLLFGNTGSVQTWQYSTNGSDWSEINPIVTSNQYTVKGITETTLFRLIDKNGVCPADTSSLAQILFNSVPFPNATANPVDTTICFGTPATLNTNIFTGTSYSWSPSSAGNGNISGTPSRFSDTVLPDSTTSYVLKVVNEGCPNALYDTLLVQVLPKVIVDAGNDTSLVTGEPIQFHATSSDAGPDLFSWLPGTELSNPSIPDPTAIYNDEDYKIRYTIKATTPFGCSGEGFITVKIFKTKPDIFVPNAFTPDQASNPIFRPIPVGVTSLDYFRIYNRLGQLVYSTTAIGSGWNGLLHGVPQASGAYVWMVKGTDYIGSTIVKSGTMVLIR